MIRYKYKTVGKRIREARQKNNISQYKLADAVTNLISGHSLSRTAIVQWERGNVKCIEGVSLIAISHILGVSPEWLLFGKEINR